MEFIIHLIPSAIKLLPILKYNFSLVCHTDPNKLLSLGSIKTLTCARCTGIYFGGLFSSTIVLFGFKKNIDTKFFLISSLPILIDILLYSLKFYNYSIIMALFTGLLLGSTGFLYIQDSITELFNKNEGGN